MKNKTKLLIRDAFFSTLLTSFLILVLGLLLSLRFFNPLQKALYDFSFLDVFYSEGFQGSDKVNTDIILVNIGDESRAQIGKTLQAIIKEGPRTVGVDILFPDRKEDAKADSLLASLLSHETVVTSYKLENGVEKHNHPYFGNNEKSGFINFNFNDETTVVREFIGKSVMNDLKRSSFASQMAKHYLADKWDSFGYDEKLKKTHTIKYLGDFESFVHMNHDDLQESNNRVFKDKLVILGYLGKEVMGDTTDIQDKYFTPLNKYMTGKSDADMYGASIHANITRMLIHNDFMLTVSYFWLGIITFIAMFLSTIFYMKINKKYKVSFRTRKRFYQFIVCVAVLLMSFWLFKLDLVLKPSFIIVGIILAGSYFKYYKHLTRYLKTKSKRKWKTYLK